MAVFFQQDQLSKHFQQAVSMSSLCFLTVSLSHSDILCILYMQQEKFAFTTANKNIFLAYKNHIKICIHSFHKQCEILKSIFKLFCCDLCFHAIQFSVLLFTTNMSELAITLGLASLVLPLCFTCNGLRLMGNTKKNTNGE